MTSEKYDPVEKVGGRRLILRDISLHLHISDH